MKDIRSRRMLPAIAGSDHSRNGHWVTALPRHRTVGDVMTAHVHVADPRTPFKLLMQIIEENRISAVPIVGSNGMPIGVVSASDLVLKERRTELESGNGPLHTWRPSADQAKGVVAADVMTSPAVTVSIDTPIAGAARVMHQLNVRRLVVVDQRLRVAGIVTRSDLLKVFMRTDEDLRGEVSEKLIPADIPVARRQKTRQGCLATVRDRARAGRPRIDASTRPCRTASGWHRASLLSSRRRTRSLQ